MYSWFLGDQQDFKNDPEAMLLGVKSLLPRWMNGIPDAQFMDIFYSAVEAIENFDQKKNINPILCETGIGASTIAMAGAIAYTNRSDVKLFNWDINGRKQSEIRTVLSESLCTFSTFELASQLLTITSDAKSSICGIPVIGELGKTVIFGCFDSLHVQEQILEEISLTIPFLTPDSIVYIDDQFLNCKGENIHLGNLARKKLGLGPIPALEEVKFKSEMSFGSSVRKLLESAFVVTIRESRLGTEQTEKLDSVFFAYYSQDRVRMREVGAELSSSSRGRAMSFYIVSKKNK